jgi:5-methyltetrahydropteroyltriglutamate--homocysteine methyltransferase
VKRSTDRIITSHAGSLVRPAALRDLLVAKNAGRPYDEVAFQGQVREAVADGVRRQVEAGIDVVTDGELSKLSFTNYARERLGGIEERDTPPDAPIARVYGRDMEEFPEYFAGRGNVGGREAVVVGPLRYIGQAAVQADIDNLKAALAPYPGVEAFLPAVAPGTIEHWLGNAHYGSEDDYLQAIADAMHEEYSAIVDAGFVLQVDDPDLGDGWQVHREMDIAAYHRFAEKRIDALNHALRGIPEDRVRFHMCWGSYHGPHKYDIPLAAIVDLVYKVRAECYSIEASNPRHEHEWRVFEVSPLPAGKSLMPGVVGHASDFVEHPELIAQRLLKYARLVGRENVIAGTDCGIPPRVGHETVGWAKLRALVEGAKLASAQLW